MSTLNDSPKRLIALRDAERHGVLDEPIVLSRAECEDIVQRALKASKADACRVSVNSSYATNVRFADNQMSTSGISDDASISITAFVGKRNATVLTNDLGPGGLERAVAQAEALARLSPEDPEQLPELGPQRYIEIPAWFDSTATLSAEDRARAALSTLELTRRASDITAAGFIECTASSRAVGNSAGLFAFHRSTNANYSLTVRTTDGTGSSWMGADENDWAKIDFRAISTGTAERARASRNPQAIEPGRYTVIFEPQASADLLGSIGGIFSARAADEGRSALSKAGGGTKLGEKILDSRVTLLSDPADSQVLGAPFAGDGLPQGRQVWVENGVVKQLSYDRFWAQKTGNQPTGGGGGFGGGGNFKMLGGDSTLDDMIKSADRAVLVTRLWYLRPVNNRTLVFTGLTRDGTFLVENGRITRSIKNMRFNDSGLIMLNSLDALGPTVRTNSGGVFPAVKSRDFSFTSLSDAV